jgi:hypothetical protein
VDESVLFEVADFALCLQLCNRLDQDWDAHVLGRTESHFVAVGIDPDAGRMEADLRSVPFHVGEKMSVVFAKDGTSF